ncbi:MAG: hypothetical protein AAFV43_06080 [Planctomycetota bacterium]
MSAEQYYGSVTAPPYPTHGWLLWGGHLGATTNFYLTDPTRYGYSALLGDHSFVLRAGDSVGPSADPNQPRRTGANAFAYPVVSQRALIPSDKVTVLMVIADELAGRTPSFSVRIDDSLIDMREVEAMDYLDYWIAAGLWRDEITNGGQLYAGDITYLHGQVRDLRVRAELPSDHDPLASYFSYPGIVLDAVGFSSTPVPWAFIPEPTAFGGAMLCLAFAAQGRRWHTS